jgi:hypothetical protein
MSFQGSANFGLSWILFWGLFTVLLLGVKLVAVLLTMRYVNKESRRPPPTPSCPPQQPQQPRFNGVPPYQQPYTPHISPSDSSASHHSDRRSGSDAIAQR